ncbi:hypothetical protein ACLMJK_009113 [Lecanora helva]
MPPHHPLFGHLMIAKDALSQVPRDLNPTYIPGLIKRAFPDIGPVFYLDMWPFAVPILVASSPSAAYQFTQDHSLPKANALRNFLKPLTNNQDLVSLEGQAWKSWRKIYNPGFSGSHLISLVPQVAREVLTFRDLLRARTNDSDVLPLEGLTVNLTMDVIGKVILDTHFHAQRSTNEFVSALRADIPWLSAGTEINPFRRWNPFRPLVHWYYGSIMSRYLNRELEQRFAAHKSSEQIIKTGEDRSASVMDLALSTYRDENPGLQASDCIDPDFKKFAVNQIKIFMLAGHDTTSMTICYIFYLLAGNPHCLQRIRAEHDEVFGPDTAQTYARIVADPYSLNQLPFTVAVIKETMRLFPAASSTRSGEPGFSLSHDGHQYPTNGFIVWSLHQALHREPSCWPKSDDFIPERWLAAKGDPMYPISGAWRPFEFGPRNCIGQELAMLEMKIVLAMTVREFDIQACYEEWDQLKGKKGPKTVSGERAYQVLNGTTRPAEGFPCRVRVAKR